jgi:DNA-binding response OmpR family regulator/tRNA A-37 threonylcarbamoyl transferase component Bud32
MSTDKHDSRIPRELRHDLMTPIHQIIGYVQMLQEDLSDGEQVLSDLRKVETAALKLLGIINSGTAAPPDAGTAPPAPASEETLKSSSGATILVVDDEELNRDMLSRRLHQRGYAVKTAPNGTAAVQTIVSERIDLVLLDLMMPGMSGMDVLREVRATHSADALPIIMATARDSADDVVSALAAGANDYVTKPIDFRVALARIDLHLSLKAATEQLRTLNRQLRDSQDRIARLMATSSQALDDLSGWAGRSAAELAQVLGAQEVAVWSVDGEDIQPLTPTSLQPPTFEELRQSAQPMAYESRGVLVPVIGLTGEHYGAITIAGRIARLDDLEERLVLSFAHQLGGALEVRHTREMLAEAQEVKRSRQQELIASGVDLLGVCARCGTCYDHTVERCPEDGAAVVAPRVLPFRIAGRYRLLRLIGQGGMGTVFAAFDERLQRSVAIKLINADRFDDASARLRFEREMHALARVPHPGVTALYDSGELYDSSAFMVMELLDGCDLKKLLRVCGPGTPAQIARFLHLAASALESAHQAGVVHRDIKPPNIFLIGSLPDFQVKILDFGIAKPLDAGAHLTETGVLVGTPAYMAPEQLGGKTIDRRTDVYALAAVGYEALTGHPVTDKTDFASIILDVLHRGPALVSRFMPGIPPAIDAAFAAGLSVDPDARPATVGEWVSSFGDALEGLQSTVAGWVGNLAEIGRAKIIQSVTTTTQIANTGEPTLQQPEDGTTLRV